jgi:hypothetical protein
MTPYRDPDRNNFIDTIHAGACLCPQTGGILAVRKLSFPVGATSLPQSFPVGAASLPR